MMLLCSTLPSRFTPSDPHLPSIDPEQATKEMKKGLPDWREME
jgi:hypothetical protein